MVTQVWRHPAITIHNRLQKNSLQGRTITLKIKYADFNQITRSRSLSAPTASLETLLAVAKELLLATNPEESKIRLLGIAVSNFGDIISEEKSGQMIMFCGGIV